MNKQDKESIYICALRYCMGRQTYMPSLVVSALKPELPKLDKKTLVVMLRDCEEQEKGNIFGSEIIDKPLWLQWRKSLEEEIERRKENEVYKNYER